MDKNTELWGATDSLCEEVSGMFGIHCGTRYSPLCDDQPVCELRIMASAEGDGLSATFGHAIVLTASNLTRLSELFGRLGWELEKRE